jgi:hypothetical protein
MERTMKQVQVQTVDKALYVQLLAIVPASQLPAVYRALTLRGQDTNIVLDHLQTTLTAEIARLVEKGERGLAADRLVASGEIEIGRAAPCW